MPQHDRPWATGFSLQQWRHPATTLALENCYAFCYGGNSGSVRGWFLSHPPTDGVDESTRPTQCDIWIRGQNCHRANAAYNLRYYPLAEPC